MKSSGSQFRLNKRESLAGGLRRIYCEQLDGALRQMSKRPDKKNAVHNIRRGVKKLRAILRLMRDALGDDILAREDDRLRDAAHFIGALRDAQMRLRTVENLARRFSGRRSAFGKTRGMLKGELAKLSASVADSMLETARALEAARDEMDGWFPSEVKWLHIRSGLQSTYKEGRVSFRNADADRSMVSLHEWRKRVKALLYQLQLIEKLGSRAVGKLIRETEVLGELMGEIHDLDVLRAAVISHKACDERDALVSLIDLRRSKLLRPAIALGRELHAEKSKEFARRVCG